MRKLTGYIGALIVVFALMGSILAGYALNVNGESTVINEYEKVTDVSGLYTHSQEPSYIDYNPASNYIGYSTEIQEYDNPTGGYGTITFKKVNTGGIGIDDHKQIYINGSAVGVADEFPYFAVITNKFYLYYENGGNALTLWDNQRNIQASGTTGITINGQTVTVQHGGNTYSYSDVNLILAKCDMDPDYYVWSTYADNPNREIYLNDISQTVTITRYPNLGINYNGEWFSTFPPYGSTASFNTYQNVENVNNGVKKYLFGPNTSNPSYLIDSLAYPITVNSISDIGINYTGSNRVNNYPIETDYDTSQTTSTASMDLMAVSVANQFNGSRAIIDSSNSNGYTGISYVTNVYSYKLSDLMQLMNIPANTTAIKFDCPSGVYNISVAKLINGQTVYFGSYFLNNYAVITGPDTGIDRNPWQDHYTFSFNSYASQYVMYYPDTQICELFDKDGVKIGNYSGPDKIFITFVTNTTNDYPFRTQGYNADSETQYTIPARPKPFMNIFYSVTGTVTDVHYSDITKGYSIKSSNTSNVIWDNQYNNGDIQLLFRAEDTNGTYHNDITVGDNTISVDYNNGFSVTLNGGDPVAVGKWRNIVLDINLNSGELSAVPVRTFNSYTNVVLDTARMVIGDLINPAPTNIIKWAPTSNSLMFNVYSTAVFMDTYGIVMVNPTLDITDYFTDLNDFYRLRLYNFSVYGDNITVNGVTADVSGNSISIDEQTIQLKEMNITYADGHAYISDSNATIDLGAIVDNDISMSGAWYFETELNRGYTTQKTIYNWNWSDFILDNTQFCIMFMGLAIVALIVARHYCTMAITDYIVLVLSFIIALTVQVVA